MAKLVQGVNDLYTWCINNGEYGQQLISEWTGQGEDGNHYEMDNVTKGISTKMLWKCSNGHEWYSRIQHRIIGRKCPYCFSLIRKEVCTSSKLKTGQNDLYTWCKSNGDFGQQLINEWTGICDNGNLYKMSEVAYGTQRKRMLWKCSKGHEWYALILSRTAMKSGCPNCKKGLSETNNLYNWCICNSDLGNRIIDEWTGIRDNGEKYEITDVTPISGMKFLWKCSKGHTWYTRIADRTAQSQGCPYCSIKGTSYPEQFLYRALKQIYPQTISRGRFQGIEYDITIPEERTCIEYSGANWHADKIERDQMKADVCKQHNIRLIQIYANGYNSEENEIYENNLIIYSINANKYLHNIQLEQILEHILKSFNRSIEEIDIEKAQTEAFNFMHDIDKDKD